MQHNQSEWWDYRIEVMTAAKRLAIQDTNPANKTENDAMIERCSVGIKQMFRLKILTSKP